MHARRLRAGSSAEPLQEDLDMTKEQFRCARGLPGHRPGDSGQVPRAACAGGAAWTPRPLLRTPHASASLGGWAACRREKYGDEPRKDELTILASKQVRGRHAWWQVVG